MADDDKELTWIGRALDDLSAFPLDVKRDAGHQLRRLQKGDVPDHFKPMPTVGRGVAEIIVNVGDAYRVFYVATFPEAIYVLHAFKKKTRKTSGRDIDQGRNAYATVTRLRRAINKKP